jgi:DsbC/DsbD-like thiol-disulfide interchange protein
MVSLFRRSLGLSVLCAVLAFAALCNAQSPVDSSHAKVQLIAEQKTAMPGKPSWVGLLFRLDPGWHIYWQNPGDSGEPPKVQWQLPAGYNAGPILWPQPIRLGSGTVIDYGYEGQVLLMAPIEAASQGSASPPPNLSADVKYIVCREMCIPGKAHLTLSAPADGDWSRWRALFEQTRQQLPKRAPTIWKVSAKSDKTHFILLVQGAPGAKSASFFPLIPDEIDNSASQALASNRSGFQLTLKKSDQLTKPVATLNGLLILGPARSYEVSAPVRPQ